MAVDRERLSEELRRMRQLIEKDPEVKARFDTDGNGVIDGHEWEQVRQLVIARLEREAAEDAEGRQNAEEAGEAFAVEGAAAGAVATTIFDADLQTGTAVPHSIGEADCMVLEQQGGLSQVFEGAFRRRYAVLAEDGSTLGAVEQVESELVLGMTPRSIFEHPDLHFRVSDAGTGTVTTFRRTQGLARDRIDVIDTAGLYRASVEWKVSLLGRKFEVSPSGDGGIVIVKSNLLKPFSLEILDCVDDPIGSIERGWSGLGAFLTGGNRMRIRVNPGEVTPEQRWGLLAAALLADVSAEKKND
jgi:hypothetical protein